MVKPITTPTHFFSFYKKGFSNVEKIITGVVIILFLFGMSPLFLGDTFLGNIDIIEGLPVWFIPLILLILGLGVVHLIQK